MLKLRNIILVSFALVSAYLLFTWQDYRSYGFRELCYRLSGLFILSAVAFYLSDKIEFRNSLAIPRKFLVFLFSCTVVAGVLLVAIPYEKAAHYNRSVLQAISEGKVVVDDESHEWNLPSKISDFHKEQAPVKISLYVRNTSKLSIQGDLIFQGRITHNGVEESFIKDEIQSLKNENYSDDALIRQAQEIEKSEWVQKKDRRSAAVVWYVLRGQKLAEGSEFEPVNIPEKDYLFNFRESVDLKPGELVELSHDELIPPGEKGFIFKTAVQGFQSSSAPSWFNLKSISTR